MTYIWFFSLIPSLYMKKKNPLPPYPIFHVVTIIGNPEACVYAVPPCLSERMLANRLP